MLSSPKAGQPKIWMSSRRYPIFVETPSTTRAKQLASVYVRLEDSHTLDLGDDDRARALVDAITMVTFTPMWSRKDSIHVIAMCGMNVACVVCT